MAQLSRDPIGGGEITYEVSAVTGGYRVRRMCDNGSNASQYDTKGADQDYANLIAASCAAAEGGTVI